MRKLSVALLTNFFLLIANAQIQTNETPIGLRHLSFAEFSIPLVITHDYDLFQPKIAEKGKNPLFAGYSIPANIRFADHATRVQICPDTTVWQLRLHVPGATKFGLVIKDFELPGNGKLFIYNETGKNYLGAFTSNNNHSSGILSVQPIQASTIIIEYFAPGTSSEILPKMVISEIIYLAEQPAIEGKSTVGRQSQNCFVDINCPEGDMWQKQKRGVARILLREGTSWFYCTGTLVNNTREDGKPLFLTADHCGENASVSDLLVWQFKFNYEFASCNQPFDTPSAGQVITGSTLLARGRLTGGSDFRLLLLNEAPPSAWNTYFNGWSRLTDNPMQGAGIHHPNGNPKKISTFTSPLFHATYPDGMTGASWQVFWAATQSGHSVTEVGSSGSPIFDSQGLIVGTLSGGASSCTALNLPDYYGKFSKHWDANGEFDNQQLRPWLDPLNTDPLILHGFDPMLETNMVLVSINPENAGSVTGGGFYAEGEQVVLSSNPDTNFVFVNWTNEFGNQLSSSPEFSFTMPATEISVIANFAPIKGEKNEIIIGENFFIYPNPATENEILIRSERPLGLIFFRIYTLKGLEVAEGYIYNSLPGQTHPLSLAGLQTGVYLIHMIIDDTVITHRILVLQN